MSVQTPIIRSIRAEEIASTGAVIGQEGLFGGKSGMRIGSSGGLAVICNKALDITATGSAALTQDRAGRTTISGSGAVVVSQDLLVGGDFIAGSMTSIYNATRTSEIHVDRLGQSNVLFFKTSNVDRMAVATDGHVTLGPVNADGTTDLSVSGSDLLTNIVTVNGSATIRGNLNVIGETTQVNTEVKFSDKLVLNNDGSDNALVVAQSGAADLIKLVDTDAIATGDAETVIMNTTQGSAVLSAGILTFALAIAGGATWTAAQTYAVDLRGVRAAFKDHSITGGNVLVELLDAGDAVVGSVVTAATDGTLGHTEPQTFTSAAQPTKLRITERDSGNLPVAISAAGTGTAAEYGSAKIVSGVATLPLTVFRVANDGRASVSAVSGSAVTVQQRGITGSDGLLSLSYNNATGAAAAKTPSFQECFAVNQTGEVTITSLTAPANHAGQSTSLTVTNTSTDATVGTLLSMTQSWNDGAAQTAAWTFDKKLTGQTKVADFVLDVTNTDEAAGKLMKLAVGTAKMEVGNQAEIFTQNEAGSTAPMLKMVTNSAAADGSVLVSAVDNTLGGAEHAVVTVAARGGSLAVDAGTGRLGAGDSVATVSSIDDTNRGLLALQYGTTDVVTVDNFGKTAVTARAFTVATDPLLQVTNSANGASSVAAVVETANAKLVVAQEELLLQTAHSAGLRVDSTNVTPESTILSVTADTHTTAEIDVAGWVHHVPQASFTLGTNSFREAVHFLDASAVTTETPLAFLKGSKLDLKVGTAAQGVVLRSEQTGVTVQQTIDDAAAELLRIESTATGINDFFSVKMAGASADFIGRSAHAMAVRRQAVAATEDEFAAVAATVDVATAYGMALNLESDSSVRMFVDGAGHLRLGRHTVSAGRYVEDTSVDYTANDYLTVAGSAVIRGNLTVQGVTTTIDTDAKISDQLFVHTLTNASGAGHAVTFALEDKTKNVLDVFGRSASATLTTVSTAQLVDPITGTAIATAATDYFSAFRVNGTGQVVVNATGTNVVGSIGVDIRGHGVKTVFRVNDGATGDGTTTDLFAVTKDRSVRVAGSPQADGGSTASLVVVDHEGTATASPAALQISSAEAKALTVVDPNAKTTHLMYVTATGDLVARDTSVDTLVVENTLANAANHISATAAVFGAAGNQVWSTAGAAKGSVSTTTFAADVLTFNLAGASGQVAFVDLKDVLAIAPAAGSLTVTVAYQIGVDPAVQTATTVPVAAGPVSVLGAIALDTPVTDGTATILSVAVTYVDAGATVTTLENVDTARSDVQVRGPYTASLEVQGNSSATTTLRVNGQNTSGGYAPVFSVNNNGNTRVIPNTTTAHTATPILLEPCTETIYDSDARYQNVSTVTADAFRATTLVSSKDGAYTGYVTITGFTEYAYPSVSGTVTSKYGLMVDENVAAKEVHMTSDRRLKKDIADLDAAECAAIVRDLKPKSYSWANDDGNKKNFGFISQEIMADPRVRDICAIAPHAGLASDGPDSPENAKVVLNYVEFIPVLTSALQSAMAEIAALKAEVAALKA